MEKISKALVALLFSGILLVSCSDDADDLPQIPDPATSAAAASLLSAVSARRF